MNREEKAELIKKLNSTFNNAGVVVVTHQSGLTVEESSDLRVRMREVGARYQVAKNRIVKLALKETKYENIIDLFSGPTAIAVSEDPVSAPKTIFKFAKENDKFVIKSGALPNEKMDEAKIKALASLPSREELLAKLMGTMQAPIAKFVRTLNEVPTKFVRGLAAVRDQKEAQA